MNNGGMMDKIIGHEKVRFMLDKIIKDDKIGHAYLFWGKEGIGKKMVATDFAKKIMTRDGDGTFNESDFKVIMPEKDTIKVDAIRELIGEIYLRPTYAKRKVFIIDDADKMNTSAQNALLKVLEEPPLYATLILIVANKEKIIKTILSRVSEVKFDSLSEDDLREIVGDSEVLKYARGSASRALSLMEDNCYEEAFNLINLIESKSLIDINKKINELKSSDKDFIKIFEFMKCIYHKDISNDTYRKIKIIALVDETIKNLNRNANVDLMLDKFIINVCKI